MMPRKYGRLVFAIIATVVMVTYGFHMMRSHDTSYHGYHPLHRAVSEKKPNKDLDQIEGHHNVHFTRSKTQTPPDEINLPEIRSELIEHVEADIAFENQDGQITDIFDVLESNKLATETQKGVDDDPKKDKFYDRQINRHVGFLKHHQKLSSQSDLQNKPNKLMNFLKERAPPPRTEPPFKNFENIPNAINTGNNINSTNIFIKSESIGTSKCCHILANDSLVRNCISGDIIGRIPGKTKTQIFNGRSGDSSFRPREDSHKRQLSFENVYLNKAWGHSWDVNDQGRGLSGRGATLPWTQEAIAGLHTIISHIKQDLGVSRVRVLDAPCGDMVWMSRFLETRNDVDYTGVDIVPTLIDNHKKNLKNHKWTFLLLDVVEEKIPGSFDLILCRTLLQHLFFPEVFRVLNKFSKSGSKYLFTTSFSKEIINSELEINQNNPGRFRELNLEIPPFALVPPLCIQRDGPPGDFDGWKHFLGLWELPLRQVLRCDHVKQFKLMRTDQELCSCVEWSPYIDFDSV